MSAQPGDYLYSVLQLLGQILISHETIRIASTAAIHPDSGVAVTREITVHAGVTNSGEVTKTIRNQFENGRHRLGVRILGQPHPGGQPAAVRHRNPQGLNFFDRPREGIDNLHARFSATVNPR